MVGLKTKHTKKRAFKFHPRHSNKFYASSREPPQNKQC